MRREEKFYVFKKSDLLYRCYRKHHGAARKVTVATPHAKHHGKVIRDERVYQDARRCLFLRCFPLTSNTACWLHKWSHRARAARVCSEGWTKVTVAEQKSRTLKRHHPPNGHDESVSFDILATLTYVHLSGATLATWDASPVLSTATANRHCLQATGHS